MSTFRKPQPSLLHMAAAITISLASSGVAVAADAPSNLITPIPLPQNVDVPQSNPTLPQLQHDFDVMSWNTFVALSWPANAEGQQDPATPIGKTDAPAVWETWNDLQSVFLTGSGQPPVWGQQAPLPTPCQALGAQAGTRVMTGITKTMPTATLPLITEPFNTGPLIDQNGQYVRFTIQMNQSMFNYILANNLWNRPGQQAFKASHANGVNFSCPSATDTEGAVMVKAAWKVLSGADNPAKFHTTQAYIYNPDPTDPGNATKGSCAIQTMGLAGFHIGHKVTASPQWIWSTFEQVDNVPNQTKPDLSKSYNFFNSTCGSNCPSVNTPPPRPWLFASPGQPSQIARTTPVTADAAALNGTWQALLKTNNPQSTWAHYELISTQWPTQITANNGCAIDRTTYRQDGFPAPAFLANSTLESYTQGTVPNASSSCIACHQNATDTTGNFSDFTYMLQYAQPLPSASQTK